MEFFCTEKRMWDGVIYENIVGWKLARGTGGLNHGTDGFAGNIG